MTHLHLVFTVHSRSGQSESNEDFQQCSAEESRMKIQKIAIVGGTHGNEYTGPYLLNLLKKRVPPAANYSTFELNLFFSNPKAYKNNVRFVDDDLNRSFLKEDLSNYSLDSYESNRAKVINQVLGPKEQSKTDLIIDIHSTTANMGVSVILVNDNMFNLQLASYIKYNIPNVYIYYIPPETYTGKNDHPFLNSLAKYGFALELGPIPNGVVRYDILMQAYDVTLACLAFIEKKNKGLDVNFEDEIEIYEHVKTVEFPLNSDGKIDAVIHENIQDMDYKPLENGVSIFEKLDGEVVVNHEDEIFFPVFINEAAYYYKNIAFSLTRKKKIKLSMSNTNATPVG
jgi:aspartoacylase